MEDFKINFITYSPFDHYIDYVGGVMVCHSLANSLHLLGENSYIYSNSTKSTYNSQTIPYGTSIEFDERNTILIMPTGAGEHTYESRIPDVLNSIPNKIRWLINDQVKTSPPEDPLYRYCDYFKTIDSSSPPKLSSIDIEYDIFYNKNISRSGTCFYSKGQTPKNPLHHSSDLCLDNIYTIPESERNLYLSKVFNEKEYFICYSHRSFTAVLAALCGCIVIVVPYDDTPYEYWVKNFPTMRYGIAYGRDRIDHAIQTTHLVKDNLESFEKECNLSITNMRDNSYKWLTNKYNL